MTAEQTVTLTKEQAERTLEILGKLVKRVRHSLNTVRHNPQLWQLTNDMSAELIEAYKLRDEIQAAIESGNGGKG